PMRRILFTTAVLLFTAAATLASSAAHLNHDDVAIAGRIVDESDGAPIAGASVSLRGASFVSVSRANGAYELRVPARSVAGGGAVLLVRALGVAPAEAAVTVQGGVAFHDFRLRPAPVSMEEVVVTGVDLQGREMASGKGEAVTADATGAPPPV